MSSTKKPLPKIGEVSYDTQGKPICHICGNSFHRILCHVRQKHNLSARQYKKKFGLDLIKGVCSRESHDLASQRNKENFETVVGKNLLLGGIKTRFKKGCNGRTKDKVSLQTKRKLRERLLEEPMNSILKKQGKKVGESGLGNKVRWGKDKNIM